MRNDFLPILAARISDRSFHQTEIPAGIVNADVKKVSVVVRVIFHIVLAGLHDFPLGHGRASRNVANFAGGMAGGKKQDVRFAARLSGKDIKFLILLFISKRIGAGGACGVAEYLELTLGGVVFDAIENRLVVVGPDD